MQGWFTNNRKRKYQKVLKAAKSKNRDLSYVKEVMKIRFEVDSSRSEESGNKGGKAVEKK